ncbi:MAG: type IV pilus twitching motility protein PilT [Thermodesulfovibrionales bacterium]
MNNNIIQVFNAVLKKGVEIKASDVHLCIGSPWKYRHQGHIVPINSLKPLSLSECETIARHILVTSLIFPENEVDQHLKTIKDIDCAYSLPGIARFRVNICRQRGSFSIVLRVVPFEIPTIENLGLPPVIREIALEERGLVLVTGITGSGKSTTLASMVGLINQTKPCKIVTIEDPIEFLHRENKASIIQREVGPDTESFSIALRAAMRQDPDIILVGEMRDQTTIETALKAAETGHLVMSTLHTTDAPKTIQRIISAFELSEQQTIRMRLADCLKAVISQRLLRRKDGNGRVAVLEVMRNTLTIKDSIENPEKTGGIKDFIAMGRDQYGMQTFDQHLMELYSQGVIDLATAKAAATSAADFERNVQFTS